MTRLKKLARGMKWVITCHAPDGRWQETFDNREKGIQYLEEQTGKDDLGSKSDAELSHLVDNSGRTFSFELLPYGKCEICNQEGTVVNIRNHDVCYDCWDGYECGLWDIDKKGKIVKNEDF
jgi:hypothetical protein